MSRNFYSYYPFLQPSGSYYSIDDIGYIAVKSALPDMDKVAEGGEIRRSPLKTGLKRENG